MGSGRDGWGEAREQHAAANLSGCRPSVEVDVLARGPLPHYRATGRDGVRRGAL